MLPHIASALSHVNAAARLHRTDGTGDLERFWELEQLITDAMKAVGKTLDYLERIER